MQHELKTDPVPTGQLTGGQGFSELDVLKGMLAASNDACWCMEFSSPVDLTAPDDEVVRQIFGNHPVWRHCNPAMERLYRLPPGENLNAHEVREIFPDNHSNREFVRNLIANGFEVDAAPALDTRYDGQQIYVENDVRAHISDGKLFRMFGTVRNVDKHRRREHALRNRLAAFEGMIAAIPNPFFAIDCFDVVEAVNFAGESWLGIKSDALLGQLFEVALKGTKIDVAWPELAAALTKVKTLAIPITERFSGGLASVAWQIAPRETSLGTGCIIMIVPDASGSLDR